MTHPDQKSAFRTRDEQLASLMDVVSPHAEYPYAARILERHLLEAEVRGAEERGRYSGQPTGWVHPALLADMHIGDNRPESERFTVLSRAKIGARDIPLYTRPANVAALEARIAELEGALRAADQFITNGIEFGYIRMPDPDTPDTALATPGIIRAALKREGGE